MNPKDHYSITEKDFENCLKIFFVFVEQSILNCAYGTITNENPK